MDSIITDMCDLTIDNYRQVKENLRYDGEYINHFSSLVYSNIGKEIPTKKVKEIRTLIKDKTSRMSYFRGDILYILSFLLGKEKNINRFIEEIIDTYDQLIEAGFRESQYLVLSAYSLVKYGDEKNRFSHIYRMKEIYDIMKDRYDNVTNDEDYLECTLLALNNVDDCDITDWMDVIFESVAELDMFSRNSVQGLTMALLLNKNPSALYTIHELLIEFEERDMKISHQFLPLLGAIAGYDTPSNYVDEVKAVIDYLCEEEALYEFYMDKSFRTFIAIALVEFSKNIKEERYLNELLAIGVYSFLVSKNQGVFSEILA
ncbi:DUF4003 family protein [Clostridium paraputrificum]|uniref:DUF4003 family protein n=1 Tax=Clostridium TaxID=1485 RepID=UPI003D3558B5